MQDDLIRIQEHTLNVLQFGKIKEILAGYAGSPLGRKAALQLQPLPEPKAVQQALQQAQEMMRLHDQQERLPVAGLRDLTTHFDSVHQHNRPFEPEAFLEIAATLKTAAILKRYLARLDQAQYPQLVAWEPLIIDLEALAERISATFDSKAKVADNASVKLANLRACVRELRAKIRERLEHMTAQHSIRSVLQHTNITMRGNRYVLAVRAGARIQVPGVLHDYSQSGLTEYVEPAAVVSMGNELERAIVDEAREVNRILWERTREVLDQETDIRRSLQALAALDLNYAKARYARDYHMVVPTLRQDGVMQLRQLYHPYLLWLARYGEAPQRPDNVVPIDIRLGADFSMLIITGPNTGGKTVALATVGLCCLMTQAGLPIPAAAGAEVPLYRQIFVDIGDEQSMEQSLSTFSAHLTRVAEILKHADAHSLVLLDELGAGTDPAEGAALGEAVLDYLMQHQVSTIITTHLGKLKAYAYTHLRAQNACTEFDAQTLCPKYRLLIGQPGRSNALLIAARLGIPDSILEHARQLLQVSDQKMEEHIEKLAQTRYSAEQDRQKAQEMLSQAQNYRDQQADQLAALQARQQNLAREADQEIDRIVQQFQRLVNTLAQEFKNAPKPWSQRLKQFQEEVGHVLQHIPLEQKRQQYARRLKSGDMVYIPKFHEKLPVKKVNKKRQTVCCLKGNAEIEIAFADIGLLNLWEPLG